MEWHNPDFALSEMWTCRLYKGKPFSFLDGHQSDHSPQDPRLNV